MLQFLTFNFYCEVIRIELTNFNIISNKDFASVCVVNDLAFKIYNSVFPGYLLRNK